MNGMMSWIQLESMRIVVPTMEMINLERSQIHEWFTGGLFKMRREEVLSEQVLEHVMHVDHKPWNL